MKEGVKVLDFGLQPHRRERLLWEDCLDFAQSLDNEGFC